MENWQKLMGRRKRRNSPTQEQRIKDFYKSWEWKRLRYDYIKGKNKKCECCGTSPSDGIRIIVDHIKPIRYHWNLRLDRDNLQLLCDDCNMGKGSRDDTNWSVIDLEAERRLRAIKQQLGEGDI